jgi:hypothetical protein
MYFVIVAATLFVLPALSIFVESWADSGSIGLLSLALPGWLPAAALAGGLFYGFAGVGHIFHAHRNKLENVAMISDLMISVLLICLVLAATSVA